ncbi:MAG: hypothetical protein Tsb004_15340 [Allomuricauda sp.]
MLTFRLKMLLVAWLIICLVIALEMKLMGYYKPESGYSDLTVLVYFFVQFLAGLLLIVAVVIPLYDAVKKFKNKWIRLFGTIVHGILFGFSYTVLFALIFEYYNENGISTGFKDRFYNLLVTDFHNAVRSFLIFMSILYANDYFKKSMHSLLIQKNLENEVDKVKLQSLKAQLQPHFLFNALNNIVALIDENKRSAQQVLINLSDLLRYTMSFRPDKLVSLEKEIYLLKKYIAIEKAKHEDKLHVEWKINDNVSPIKLPPLILQPLIENSIKHGFVDFEGILHIIIEIKDYQIRVLNNGSALSTDFMEGQGLSIVKNRLKAYLTDAYAFRIYQDVNWVINEIVFYEDM